MAQAILAQVDFCVHQGLVLLGLARVLLLLFPGVCMGAGASVLQGGIPNVHCFGGLYGYTYDFPPGFFDESDSSDSVSDDPTT